MSQLTAHVPARKAGPLKRPDKKRQICLACGKTRLPRRRRRYCSDKCRKRLDFALYIATGLIQALRARYAAFSYTEEIILLDILPLGSEVISRFVCSRSEHNTVADDLLQMIEQAGREWYQREEEGRSRWWATQQLLKNSLRKDIPLGSIVPISKKTPRLNNQEKNALRLLELTREELLSEQGMRCIKTAYRKKAKRYHPDKGETSNKFVLINEAHAQLLGWAENPRFHSRTALPDSWCYDAMKKRWAPPA